MKWDSGSASDRRHSADQMRRNGLCEWFSLSKTEGFGGVEVGGVGVGGDEPLTAARGDERGRVSEDQISLSVSLHQ